MSDENPSSVFANSKLNGEPVPIAPFDSQFNTPNYPLQQDGDQGAGSVAPLILPQARTVGFLPIDLSNPTDGQQVRISLGIIKDPSGVTWVPSGMTTGDAPPNWYVVPVSGSGFFWAVETFDPITGAFSSVTLDQGTTVPADTSTITYLPLGTYDADTDPTKVFLTGGIGDQQAALCGGKIIHNPL